METSRIRQALNSVQLFVQRCLINLEQLGTTDRRPSTRRRSTGRPGTVERPVRAVGGEPGSVPHPRELAAAFPPRRHHPVLRRLPERPIQNHAAAANTESRVPRPTWDLEQVASLDVRGVYYQDIDPDTGEAVDILHVFARTAAHTRQVLLPVPAQRDHRAAWTAWEEVPLDIQGDLLVPVIWQRRLRLIWPIFLQQAVPSTGGHSHHTPPRGAPPPEPRKAAPRRPAEILEDHAGVERQYPGRMATEEGQRP